MENQYNQPAFPPQWAMDSLQRVVAPISGLTKLEYLSAQFLPYFLGIARQIQTENNDPYAAAVAAAKHLLEMINESDKKSDIQIL
jgi:hypothetical protein